MELIGKKKENNGSFPLSTTKYRYLDFNFLVLLETTDWEQ